MWTYCDYRSSIFLFEFPESTAINDTSNDISHIKCLSNVRPYDTMKFRSRIQWVFGFR